MRGFRSASQFTHRLGESLLTFLFLPLLNLSLIIN